MTAIASFSLTEAEQLRIDHIDGLVARGAAGVDELLASLSDPSWTVRRAGIAALAALGDDSVASLCTWLCDQRTEEHSIAAAVDALSASIGDSTNGAVITLLGNSRPEVAADAAQILGRRRASIAIPMLGRAIVHVDDNVAVAAIEALGAIGGGGAVDQLIAAVRDRNFFRTFPALQVLAKSGDPRAVAPLASLLDDAVYSLDAVRALGQTGSAQAIAPLASVLPKGAEAGDQAIVRVVALALADLVERAEWNGSVDQVVETLRTLVAPSLARFTSAIPTTDPAERAALTAVLGRIGDATLMPTLARLLDDPEVHGVATEAIQRILQTHEDAQIAALGVDSATRVAVLPVVSRRRAGPAIRALLHDEEAEVRARACDALARIGDSSAVPELFAALDDVNPRVGLAATAAIHSLGVPDTGERAIAALETGTPTVRRYALRIIAYMGFAEAFDAVCVAIQDSDPRIAELAVTSLGPIDDARVDGVLAEISKCPDPALRASAMRAAVQRPAGGSTGLLEHGLTDEFAWVRYYACQGLGRLGRVEAVDLLVARLVDVAPQVRIAAIEALAQLDTPTSWTALCAAVASIDPDEQRAALVSLGMHQTAAALPFLVEGAASVDVATRLIALSGLARRSEELALEFLAAAARDPISEVREAALSLLGERVDRAAADAVVTLALTCEPHHKVQLTLSRAGSARIAAITARLAIASATGKPLDDRQASILTAALARMRVDAATATLFEALTATNPSVRRSAATMLAAMGVDGAAAAVARIAKEDPDLDVRRLCAALVAE